MGASREQELLGSSSARVAVKNVLVFVAVVCPLTNTGTEGCHRESLCRAWTTCSWQFLRKSRGNSAGQWRGPT